VEDDLTGRRELTKWEHYKIFRDYMQREDELINYRINWNLAIQGFLFATYGFSLQKLAEVQSKALIEKGSEAALRLGSYADVNHLKALVAVIPWVGGVMAFVVWLAVWGAKMALRQLDTDWNDIRKIKYPAEPFLPGMTGGGVPSAVSLGFYAPLAIPLIFVLAWLWVGGVYHA